jgi:hypothetical protein
MYQPAEKITVSTVATRIAATFTALSLAACRRPAG